MFILFSIINMSIVKNFPEIMKAKTCVDNAQIWATDGCSQ
jgi:hypothetical protein